MKMFSHKTPSLEFNDIKPSEANQELINRIKEIIQHNYEVSFAPYTEEQLGLKQPKNQYILKMIDDGIKFLEQDLINCKIAFKDKTLVAVVLYKHDPEDNNILLLDLELTDNDHTKPHAIELTKAVCDNLVENYLSAPKIQTLIRTTARDKQNLYQNIIGFARAEGDIKTTGYKRKIFDWPGSYEAFEYTNPHYKPEYTPSKLQPRSP